MRNRLPLLVVAAFPLSAFIIVACGGGDDGTTGGTTGDGGAESSVTARTDSGGTDSGKATDASEDAKDAGPKEVTLGGTVVGLVTGTGDAGLDDAGTGGLVLSDGAEQLTVFANGAFTFKKSVAAGSSFTVTVAGQPTNPVQACTVNGGSGKAGTSNITSVTVNCDPTKFTVGGKVKGLRTGTTLTLASGTGETANVAANGDFAFPNTFASGSSLTVAPSAQPGTQKCFVDRGALLVDDANVSDVGVTCYDEISIVGAGNPAVTDFEVALDLPAGFDYARASATGDDLRFYASHGGATVPYYLETWSVGGVSRAWIKVPEIAADGTTKLLMFAGDAALAAGSNGSATFRFFDDFSGNALDGEKWEVRGTPSTNTVADGMATFQGNNNWEYARSKTSFTSGVVEVDYATVSVSGAILLGNAGSDNRYTFRNGGSSTGTTFDPDVSGGNAWFDQSYPGTPRPDATLRHERITFAVNGSNQIAVSEYCNMTSGNCAGARALTDSTGTEAFFGFTSYSSSYTVIMDRVFIRKSAAGTFTVSLL